jgi:dTDP-4-dehydrorhamnose 3,5-epimerase
MTFIETYLEGCFIIDPKVIADERGYFMESFNSNVFAKGIGAEVNYVQDNQSFSSRGVLRGLHYQTGRHAQAKLVRVITGEVLDIAVDIRPGSKTFGQHVSVVLSAENKRQLFIPRGFAHGFLVISETATFFYKCDNFYNQESEGGIIFNDPVLGIDWQYETDALIISDKDRFLPTLEKSRPAW